jgi:ABC-type oligopeptide transport system substrate-binding subunit
MVKIKKCLLAFLLPALFLIAGLCSPSAYAAPFALKFVKGSDFDTLDPSISRSRPTAIIFQHLFNALVNLDFRTFKLHWTTNL